MKKNALFILAAVLLFACNKDEDGYDNYHQRLGIYELTGEGTTDFQVNLDDGNVLIPTETSGNFSGFENGERVLALYSTITSTTNTDGNELINSGIHLLESVLTKNVITLTDEIADSIGNNTIHVHEEDIWFSKNYLNVYFSYYGRDKIHYLNMIKYPNDSLDADGRLVLELRHNSNDDLQSYAYDGFVSFDMNSLKQPGVDSIPIVVKVLDYYEDSVFWKDTYYFEENTLSTKMVDVENLNFLIK